MEMRNEKAGAGHMTDITTGVEFDGNYKKWISEVSNRFKASQIKASIKVNDEMLRFYWLLVCTLLIWFFIDIKLYHKNDCIPTFRLECSRFFI